MSTYHYKFHNFRPRYILLRSILVSFSLFCQFAVVSNYHSIGEIFSTIQCFSKSWVYLIPSCSHLEHLADWLSNLLFLKRVSEITVIILVVLHHLFSWKLCSSALYCLADIFMKNHYYRLNSNKREMFSENTISIRIIDSHYEYK